VREGRRAEFARFAEFQTADARARIPDPVAPETFLKSRLDWSERERAPHREMLDFYRRLLDIRAREIVPRLQALQGNAAAFATAGTGGLQAHWTLTDGSRLTLRANLAGQPADARFEPVTGRLLFATHPDAADGAGALPAWSVAWRLQVPP
jgi:1,4-alpha-glucan branching enzyme